MLLYVADCARTAERTGSTARSGYRVAVPTNPEPSFVRLLTQYLDAPAAADDVARYFAEPGQGNGTYSGRHFERLGGGGDHPDHADRITAEDLIAVQTLSVTVPPEVSVQLLEGDLGAKVAAHLRAIPTDVSLLEPGAAPHVADGSPADQCWHLLVSNAAPDVGPTKASKLLARKRPQLLPVYDDVLRCALGHPASFWTTLHQTLVEQPQLGRTLTALQTRAPKHVSTLRVVDVVVWMAHQHEHRTRCKAGTATDSDQPG